jgi:hypothetical protein
MGSSSTILADDRTLRRCDALRTSSRQICAESSSKSCSLPSHDYSALEATKIILNIFWRSILSDAATFPLRGWWSRS